jgi:hypothetical protein
LSYDASVRSGEKTLLPPSCPRCGKPVAAQWLICPHCEALLQGPDCGDRGGLFEPRVFQRVFIGALAFVCLLLVLSCAFGVFVILVVRALG